jgi:hypothetical protein
MTKEEEILAFLDERVFGPVLTSSTASDALKQGVRFTRVRLNERTAVKMVMYFWSAVVGTERSTKFARMMKKEGFGRFEECLDDFRDRFNDAWLRK